MNRFRRRYGGSPLHLLLVLASLALTGYAGVRLLNGDAFGVVVWFVGAAVLHDLVLLPVYTALDRTVQTLVGPVTGTGDRGRSSGRATVNHVRVPVFLSGLLLLVWWPLVLGRVSHYTATTGLPAGRFWENWLLITAALFAASALCLLTRTWRSRRRRRAR